MINEGQSKQRSITLVTLIITIIIAGISIGVMTQSGLFGNAKDAKEQYRIAELMEKVQLEVRLSYNKRVDLDITKLKDNIESINGTVEEKNEFPIIVTVDGEKFEVSEDGEVILAGKGSTTLGDKGDDKKPKIVLDKKV